MKEASHLFQDPAIMTQSKVVDKIIAKYFEEQTQEVRDQIFVEYDKLNALIAEES